VTSLKFVIVVVDVVVVVGSTVINICLKSIVFQIVGHLESLRKTDLLQ